MLKYSEILNQRITKFLSEIHTQKNKIGELESEKDTLKKEIAHLKGQLKKAMEEKEAIKKEMEG